MLSNIWVPGHLTFILLLSLVSAAPVAELDSHDSEATSSSTASATYKNAAYFVNW